jgi:hypothetical protein
MGKRVSRTCTKVMGRSPNRNQPKTAESTGCRNQPRIGCREMLDSCQGVALAGCGKISLGIRLCLQAYRKSPKMTPTLAAGVRGLSSSQHFPALASLHQISISTKQPLSPPTVRRAFSPAAAKIAKQTRPQMFQNHAPNQKIQSPKNTHPTPQNQHPKLRQRKPKPRGT